MKGNIDWASNPVLTHGDPAYASDNPDGLTSSSRYRYYYGVRFVFKEGTSGKFGYLVIGAIIALLAVVAVYFGFVGKAMKVSDFVQPP